MSRAFICLSRFLHLLRVTATPTLFPILALVTCIPPPGFALDEDLDRPQRSSLYDDLRTFTDVLAIVQRDYVREVGSRELVEGAIKGMLTTLDPHSGYLDPNFYRDLQVQTKGEFGGLGIEITVREGLLVVVAPMEGSPAEKVGIRAGDAIVKINGRFAKDLTLLEAVKAMRGPKGSSIVVSVLRPGQSDLLDFVVVRDTITVRSVRARSLDDGIGYVRVSQFVERTGEDLRVALDSLRKTESLRGLVLDLRNNPGGLLSQAVAVADLFLREGVIVYTDGRVERQRQRFFAVERGTEPGYPVVVLVNGGSASASEIVAGALKDHGRAIIFGSKTFGKGSVQTITPLDNGGAVTLTTALYYTKSGRSIQVTGVMPDIEFVPEDGVPVPSRTRPTLQLREGDLPGAIENPSGMKEPLQPSPSAQPADTTFDWTRAPLDDWLARDKQLKRARELVLGSLVAPTIRS